jgi:hypothetical protein
MLPRSNLRCPLPFIPPLRSARSLLNELNQGPSSLTGARLRGVSDYRNQLRACLNLSKTVRKFDMGAQRVLSRVDLKTCRISTLSQNKVAARGIQPKAVRPLHDSNDVSCLSPASALVRSYNIDRHPTCSLTLANMSTGIILSSCHARHPLGSWMRRLS